MVWSLGQRTFPFQGAGREPLYNGCGGYSGNALPATRSRIAGLEFNGKESEPRKGQTTRLSEIPKSEEDPI